MQLSISVVIEKLKEIRTVFASESDFQFALAQTIKSCYPKAKVRLEYCPLFDDDMHIDILVLWPAANNTYKWIPIELKYKTKKYNDTDKDGCVFNLKEQCAQDCGCYDYLSDVSRIERIKKSEPKFEIGYAIILTNDPLYRSGPRETSNYYSFRILEGRKIVDETLSWRNMDHISANRKNSIHLSGSYVFNWKEYSNTNNSSFMYLVNTIKQDK